MTDYSSASPKAVRELIREGKIATPTTGMCDGYAQGNLVVLPKELAWDFLLFCQRNPKSCPLLEVADAGSRTFPIFGAGSDIARDIPKYRVYENGVMTGEYTDVSAFFDDPSRALVPAAVAITAQMPRVHGMPIQIGYPEAIGIHDLAHPDYGDAVTIREGEVPVFWPCGVTPQAVVMHSKPPFVITHAPGHMFITDVKNAVLKL